MRVAFLITVSSHAVLTDAYPHFRPPEFLYLQQILTGHHSLPGMMTKPFTDFDHRVWSYQETASLVSPVYSTNPLYPK